jgi:DNA-binding NarL/FixJ family response regulator
MKRPRVIVCDDHAILVEGLRGLLEPEFDLVGTAENGRALLAVAQNLKPDVVILDISMPELNGIEAARQLKKSNPNVKIVFLTMHLDVAFVTEAFRVGASGYVAKRSAVAELAMAIREVLKGRTFLTPLVTKDVVNTFLKRAPQDEKASSPLTSRQIEVLQLLAEGRSTKEISGILDLSPKTVEFHKYRIMEELGLRTTAELTQYAIRHGIVSI